MKILHVIPDMSPLSGGPVHAAFGMARAVARLGHEVAIFTTNWNGPDGLDVPTDRPVVRDGVAIHYFPVQTPRFWRLSLPFARALKQAIAGFDIVHQHALYLFENMVTDHYCRRLGVPYILRPLGTLDPYIYHRHRWRKAVMEALFQNRMIRDASALHYTTEEEMRLAAPYARGAPGAVVPLGLDPADYDPPSPPGSFRAHHPEIGDRTIILFFGRVSFKKGVDILVRAFGRLCRSRQDLHLVIAGPDDGTAGDVAGLLRAEGAAGRTTVTGMVTGAEKLALLHDSDVFVLPSHSENFGVSVIEALACGLPAVVSDKVNIWREIVAGDAGRTAKLDAEDLADVVGALVDDRAMIKRMGENGKRLVAARFSWPSIALSLERLYGDVVNGDFRAEAPAAGPAAASR